MPEEQQTDLWTQILNFLQQLVAPSWGDLIQYIPLLLLGLIGLFFLNLLFQWSRAGAKNRSRIRPRLAAGAPPPGIHLPGPSRWPLVVPIGGALILFGLAVPPRDQEGNATSFANLPMLVLGLGVAFVGVVGWLRDAMQEWRRSAVPAGEGVLLTEGSHAGLLAPGAARGTHSAASAVHLPETRPSALEVVLGPSAYVEPPPGVHLPGPSPWPLFAPIGVMFIFFGLVFSPVMMLGGLIMAVIAAVGWYLDAGYEFRQVDAGHLVEPRTRDPERAFPKRLVPLFAAIAVVTVAIAFAPPVMDRIFGTGAGGGDTAGGDTGGGAPAPVDPNVPVAVSANRSRFDKETLVVPADVPFQMQFENQEAVPHNVAILPPGGGEPLFNGEILNTQATVTYDVPALTAGQYQFICVVHPQQMVGTLTAQ